MGNYSIVFIVFLCLVSFKQVNSDLPELNEYDIRKVKQWLKENITFGQLSAVAFDNDNNVVILHRGHHIWDETAFFQNNSYSRIEQGPIQAKTVVIHNSTGNLIDAWGSNIFYMPHGLTIDADGNVWITDVALHQVFKFGPKGQMLLLTLGVKFVPGHKGGHFCKPTSVAVLDNGDFFVADGYCNSRIIKYTRAGVKMFQWGSSDFNGIPSLHPTHYSLFVPHALALIDSQQQVCVADREHGRIVCYDCSLGKYVKEYRFPDSVGYRLFSMAYAPIDGGKFYVVNGPNYQPPYYPVKGFIIDIANSRVDVTFGDFQNPHDIAVNQLGSVVYVVEYKPSRLHKFEIFNTSHVMPKAKKQILETTFQEKETNFVGHVVLGWIVTIVILVIVAMIYYFRFRREGLKWYERGDINESASLFPNDDQD